MTEFVPSPSLQLTKATKEFFGVTVLSDVDLTIEAGEIHALLGQNGSGKSTLIKILAGIYSPSPQTAMSIQGTPASFPLGADPSKHGMAFVHQNLGLAPDMSVLDNLAVGDYARRRRLFVDWKSQRSLAQEQMREFGISCDLNEDVGSLSAPSQKALIAIARAVTIVRRTHERGILVLDEPTVYLPAKEVEHLQQVVRHLAETGVGVLYVTHRLEELRGFADKATILRDGRKVAEVAVEDIERETLVELITGTQIDASVARTSVPQSAPTVMAVKRLSTARVQEVSFEVRAGEVLGLTGLVGMGQDEVLPAIFGAVPHSTGTIELGDAEVELTPKEAINRGVAYLPAERPVLSGAMLETVNDNISLPVLKRLFFEGGRIKRNRETLHVRALLDLLDVRPRDGSLLLERLSGGNQQKALLAKWLQTKPRILLLDEPVQGVDVGAKAQIFEQLRLLVEDGGCVVIASSEYEDLATLCDRVLVFESGRIRSSLEGSGITKQRIAAACFGASGDAPTGAATGAES